MTIEFLKENDSFLQKVIALSNKHKNTLGFFPEGAFREQAKNRYILIATNNEKLAGYLLFQPIQGRHLIRITHLCIDQSFLKQGLATKLLNALKEKYSGVFDGFILNCRKDYISATKFWEKYGFKHIDLRQSPKSKNYLCTWFYDFGTGIFQNNSIVNSGKIAIVLDVNIVIKRYENDSQVKSLFADWLSEEVEFFVTSETRNELNRDTDLERTQSTLQSLNDFQPLNANVNRIRIIEQEIKSILQGNSQNDISDRRQLSECIVSQIDYFITLDEGIIDKAQEIFEKYQLTIITPLELILKIDQIQNKEIYNPSKLAGANYHTSKPTSNEISELIVKFTSIELGEKRYIFKDTVTHLAGETYNSIFLVKSSENEFEAFWGYHNNPDSIIIKFIRVRKSRIKATLFKQLISNLIIGVVKEKKATLVVDDTYLDEELKSILTDFGFIEHNNYFVKIVISALVKSSELILNYQFLIEYPLILNIHKQIGLIDDKNKKTQLLLKLERLLFPLKFSDLDIPSYIVPIKFYWAGQLFDSKAADKTIYGVQNPQLKWNRENVYYRASKPSIEKEYPARILWYVSEEKQFRSRSKQIIGCSYLDDVIQGSAKNLFKDFKHYGIFKWTDILKTSKNKPEGIVKALKFSDTEIFDKGIPFRKAIEISKVNNSFQTVTKVDKEIFNEFYEILSKPTRDEPTSLNTLY